MLLSLHVAAGGDADRTSEGMNHGETELPSGKSSRWNPQRAWLWRLL